MLQCIAAPLNIHAGPRRKLPPGVERPFETVQHKSHVPKVMFLCALARPKAGQHDGKIGMWRVAEWKQWTGKNTKKHTKGEFYEEDIRMNAKAYVKFMVEDVFPRIRSAIADS